MLTRFFNIFSQWVSWLAVVLDTSHRLFPGRLAYKHELNTLVDGQNSTYENQQT